MFDRAPGGIAITDTDGMFVRANPAYQALVGYSEAELVGRGIADLTEPDDFPAAAGAAGRAAGRRQSSRARWRCASGAPTAA